MKKLISSLALLTLSHCALADVAIVVNPANSSTIDNQEITRIFLGKSKSFPDGSQALPVNQAEGTSASDEFNEKVLNKTSSQLKSYWSKLVFTGKGTAPKEVPDDAEVMKLVASNPNVIGYVDAAKVDGSVKVIATF